MAKSLNEMPSSIISERDKPKSLIQIQSSITNDRTIESMSAVVANEDAESSTEKQTGIQSTAVSALTSSMPVVGLGTNKDIAVSTQQSEEQDVAKQDVSKDKNQIEHMIEQISHTPARLETQTLRENVIDVAVAGINNQASTQPAIPAASLKSEELEKEAQKDEDSSDALVKQQSLVSDQQEALESH
jgi:hypothetical protein